MTLPQRLAPWERPADPPPDQPFSIQFAVLGQPRPKGSKRHVGNGVMVESSKALPDWMEAVSRRAVLAMRGAGKSCVLRAPMGAVLTFVFPRPKGHFGKGRNAGRLKPSAPFAPCSYQRNDVDKLARAILDALAGIVFHDDGQVVALLTTKAYADPGEPAGVIVDVFEARGEITKRDRITEFVE